MPLPLLLQVLVGIGLSVGLGYLQRKYFSNGDRGGNAVPQEIGEVTAQEGPIPSFWGTCLLRTPSVEWFGDTSQTAIIDGGSTVGYKYYMGAQLVFAYCPRKLDGITEIRFNDKPIGVIVTAANSRIVFGNGAQVTAQIEVKNYPDGGALAAAIEAAMKLAQPGNWRVTFGFQIVAGVNDRLQYIVDGKTFTAILTPGRYTGANLAAHVQTKLRDAASGEPFGFPSFFCTYSGSTFKFTLTLTHISIGDYPFTLKVTNALSTLGLRHDIDHNSGYAPVVGDYAVKDKRFIFSFGGTTATLKCTDAGFTAAILLGISTGADKTALGIAISDTDFVVVTATLTDQGDFLQIDVNDPTFFGTEGGVVGRLDVYYGSKTQAASDYLTTQFGTQAPAFRGFCHVVMRHPYIGDRNIPPTFALGGQNFSNELGMSNEHQRVGQDANPACILYDLYTDPDVGEGISRAQLNIDSFIALGEACYEEGLGLSWAMVERMDALDAIDEILRHIDATRYDDPFTALISVRLIRQDYVKSGLPIVTGDNARNLHVAKVSPLEVRNAVRVKYIDRERGYTENTFQLHDLANIESRGGEVNLEDIAFHGISTTTVARAAAERVLADVSRAPAQLSFEVNRELWSLRPGSPLRIVWPEEDTPDQVVRVTRLSPGGLLEGWIHVEAIEEPALPVSAGYGINYGQYYGGN